MSFSRVLKGRLKNITAQGNSEVWGIMQSNFMKDIVIENCDINRVDAHIHSWNISVYDSNIGDGGFQLTGGGHLHVYNTIVTNFMFANLRGDYGARLDGNIVIRDCTWNVIDNSPNDYKILAFSTTNHDFGYETVFGKSIIVENLTVDFANANKEKIAELIYYSDIGYTGGRRIEFPSYICFKDIHVVGRVKGSVSLLYIDHTCILCQRKVVIILAKI